MTKIPVTLLTGFLGSGKTTVLNTLVKQPAMSGALVIINEFGDVGLDHLLVAHSRIEGVVELSSGCLCCTIRGDLARTLKDAVWRFSRNGRRQFDRVMIESTGLADPAPILQTLLDDPALTKHYFLDGIVTTVDLANGWQTLDRHPEALRQSAVADVLLLTKADMAGEESRQALAERLRRINPGARQIEANPGSVRARDLIDLGVAQANARGIDIQAWLHTRAFAGAGHAHEHAHAHGCAHDEDMQACCGSGEPGHEHREHGHSHASNHDDGIRSCSFVLDQPLEPEAFREWREILMAFLGDRMLRLKGILNIRGESRPLVIHGVQHVFHEPVHLDAWPGEDRSSRLVFIVQDLDRSVLEQTLGILKRRNASGAKT
ncbi:CobW family GTP-binding protein [Paracandidimonas soli]|uniref:G3E family GTPase n=1 Tax=Paracandidimonas soli TaxID=1917182 RepID=A0A4R3V6Z8_9BURK|nr:GTP-binding protein [Paracandidimonas soli]TCU99138.1 G3E family GTPase [Paracandidimonas soli]